MPQYTPEPAPNSLDPVLVEWLQRELMRISNAFIGADDEATGYQPLDQDLTDIAALTTQPWGRALLTQGTEAAFKNYANLNPGPNIHSAGTKNPPVDADEFGFADSAGSWAFVKFTWLQLKTALKAWLIAQANTWTGLNVFTQTVEITGNAAFLKFSDTDAAAYDYWVHVNSNQFYVLCDRNNDGTWDGTFPMQLDASTDTPYLFGAKVWTAATDGAGSTLDADLLDGFNSSQANAVNTVAVRDASGDVISRLHRTEWTGQGWNGAFFVGMNANGGVGTDNYMRPATPLQALRAVINAGFESAQQTITMNSNLTIAHGLGVQPKLITAALININTELGYTAGQEVEININTSSSSGTSGGITVRPDSTNLNVRFGNAISIHGATSGISTINAANWKLVMRAWG